MADGTSFGMWQTVHSRKPPPSCQRDGLGVNGCSWNSGGRRLGSISSTRLGEGERPHHIRPGDHSDALGLQIRMFLYTLLAERQGQGKSAEETRCVFDEQVDPLFSLVFADALVFDPVRYTAKNFTSMLGSESGFRLQQESRAYAYGSAQAIPYSFPPGTSLLPLLASRIDLFGSAQMGSSSVQLCRLHQACM